MDSTNANASELLDALLELEKEWGISPPLGANELPPAARFREILMELKARVCPNREAIKKQMNSDAADLGSIVADVIISGLTQVPLPLTKVARRIAAITLDRFCKDPATLLQQGL